MSTITLHSHVQRRRFADHTWAALVGWLPGALRFGAKPDLAPQPRSAAQAAAVEAQRVRDLAQIYVKTDPGFASDLFAAAARHEGLYGE